jgi:hypothetical protein
MRTFNESAALGLMRNGQCLVRMHTRHGSKWFLADGRVADATAQQLIARSDVKQFDPGLFSDFDFAQSYVIRSRAHA